MNISKLGKVTKPKNLVQTIERVSEIFDALRDNPDGISVKNVSEKVKLPMGTTHRLLTSLLYFGYVSQNVSDKKYQLGFKLVELGSARLEQIDLRTIARPHLKNLAQAANESVHLVVLDENEALYLDRIVSNTNRRGLQMASKIGMRINAHCSGAGKILLSALSEDELNNFIKSKGLPRRTAKTITSADKLKTELERVRNQGYAVDDEEDDPGTCCVAAPILNESAKVIAAISISGPTIRISWQRILDTLKDQVIATASRISKEMGYSDKTNKC